MTETVPGGWTVVCLGELCTEVRNGISEKPSEEGTLPILRISAVRPMRLELTDTRHLVSDPAKWAAYRLRADDLLFTRYNGNPALVGACARVPAAIDQAIVYPDKLIRVRLDTSLALPAFIERAVHTQRSRAVIDGKLKTSAGQVGISGADLQAVPVLVPPVREQRRIVAKLDSLLTRTRRAREALDEVPALLERYRQSVLAAAFRGDLTADWREKHPEVEPASALLGRIRAERRRRWEEAELARLKAKGKAPKDDKWKAKYEEAEAADHEACGPLPPGWVWATVDELQYETQYGSSAKTSEAATGVAVLRMGNIQSGRLDFRELKYLPATHEEFPDLLLRQGDLLFNRTNTPELVGKTAVYEGTDFPCSFASYLIRLRVASLSPRLLSSYINSPFGRRWVASVVQQQVGQANVNGTKLRSLAVPVPPADEQQLLERRLVAALDGAAAQSRALAPIEAESSALERSILAKAFRGELVPQDPSDEPASVMLERIRAEREAGEKGGGKAKAAKGEAAGKARARKRATGEVG